MGTTRKSLAIFWRANMAHPWLFFGTLTSWTIGLVLQKIILPIIIAFAINTLVSVQGQSNIDYWQLFAPYIGGLALVA